MIAHAPSLAATEAGCIAGGVGLLIGMGAVAVFSRPIAEAFLASRDLITRRTPPPEDETRLRRAFVRTGTWMIRAWGGLGALGGAAVLTGLLDCP